MGDWNLILGERNFAMRCHFKEYSTNELIDELCRLCSQKEEDVRYIDIRKINVIWCLLMERRNAE